MLVRLETQSMFRYYSTKTLRGFDSYKYRALDTSPLSIYVMHPFWDKTVTLVPTWLAPNMLTFLGFILAASNFLITCYYDWGFYASSPNHPEVSPIPAWIWFVLFVFHFGSHTLDGIDGKQAKRTKSSSPLGELFDHGVDSLSTVFMPIAIFSAFGRDHAHGGGTLEMHVITWCIFFTFALSHWEKYNTQELYLPWGYDLALLGIALVYLISGIVGVQIWRFNVPLTSLSLVSFLTIGVVIANFFFSFAVSLSNIYFKYSPVNQLKYGFLDGMAPTFSVALLAGFSTAWLVLSPNNIAELEPRIFIWHQGILFSSHLCRVIIAQMTSTKCQLINWMLYPYMLMVTCLLTFPPSTVTSQVELNALYVFSTLMTIAHMHFGITVVNEIAESLNVHVFSIRKSRTQ